MQIFIVYKKKILQDKRDSLQKNKKKIIETISFISDVIKLWIGKLINENNLHLALIEETDK